MQHWEAFEATHQIQFAHLMANTNQKELFRETNKCHERMFLDLVTRVIKPSHFFEIGAYEAATAQRVAEKLPDTSCVAFEADPEVHAHFTKKHKPIRNFRYIQSAVGDYDGETTFHKQIMIDGEAAQSLLPNNSLKRKSLDIEYREVKTKCQRVDTFNAGERLIANAVLRIDVEGLCYEVLRGAGKTLANTSAIYAEVEDYEIWSGQKTVFDIYPYLEQMGFVPVSRDVQSPGQYNVLWLRRSDSYERKFRSRLALYFSELQQIASRAAQ